MGGGRYVFVATELPGTTPYTRSMTLKLRVDTGSQFAVGTPAGLVLDM